MISDKTAALGNPKPSQGGLATRHLPIQVERLAISAIGRQVPGHRQYRSIRRQSPFFEPRYVSGLQANSQVSDRVRCPDAG